MTNPDYEYHGLLASTWDLLRGDTSKWEDRFFYRDLIDQYGEPVLDVGCGTGRILLDYLADGLDIDGVDNSPEMLALCRKKANDLGLKPNLYKQEMATLALPRKYKTILVPSSSFQLVLDLEDAVKAMDRFFEHLEPGGALVMPFMVIWEEGQPTKRDWIKLAEVTRPEDGAVVRRWASDWFDPEKQFEHTENRYEILVDGEVVHSETHTQSPATRWYSQAQARSLYRHAGFANIHMYRGFVHVPASPEDTLFSLVGEKS